MKIVLIEWRDASSHSVRWTDKKDFEDAYADHCVSIGVLLRETDEEITVCLSLSESCYSQAITIPKGCMKRIRVLRIKRG